MVKYKEAEFEGWFYKIDKGVKSQSFADKGEIGKKMFAEMQKWISKGGVVEARYNAEELAEKEKLDAERLLVQYIPERATAHLPIEQQLDMIYWDKVNGTSVWVDYVTKIKTSIPKSS